MFRRRNVSNASIGMLILLTLSGCPFVDPNAPPPPDPCTKGHGTATEADVGRYWAQIDGPAACDGNPGKPDTVTHFTGNAWTKDGAYCRAVDVYVNKDTKPGNAATLQIEENLRVPSDAFGYCIVNAGTASEVISYSVCGQASAGQGACEMTLPAQATTKLTAKWFNCPGGPACPVVNTDDVCVGLGKADPSNSFVMYVDVPFLFCSAPADAGMPADGGEAPKPQATPQDERDSMFVSLGAGYGRQSAMCAASAAHDAKGNLQYGVSDPARSSPPPRDISGTRTGPVPFGADDLSPKGAKGYCLLGADNDPYQFALYSFCDVVVEKDPAMFSPQALCENGYPRVGGPRKGTWFGCPGSPLCL